VGFTINLQEDLLRDILGFARVTLSASPLLEVI
jgi:hypothetical protein